MTIYYLSAQFNRFPELKEKAEVLRIKGHDVCSTWHDTARHDLQDEDCSDSILHGHAVENLEQVAECETFIAFTDGAPGRGGRHVEFGFAEGHGKELVVIGPRETIFHHLEHVEQFDTWEDFLDTVEEVVIEDSDDGA